MASDLEAALRAAAVAWAAAQGVGFLPENGAPAGPTAVGTYLRWKHRTDGERAMGLGSRIEETGEAVGELLVGVGTGVVALLGHAESLAAALQAAVLPLRAELWPVAAQQRVGKQDAYYRLDVRLRWRQEVVRIAQGGVSAAVTESSANAYAAVCAHWDARVRQPLGLKTFLDNQAPEPGTPPPWALLSYRTLPPATLETRLTVVPGRVIAALNWHAAGGTDPAATDVIEAIKRAFDRVTVRGVKFDVPEATRVGLTPVGTWQANIRLPFAYEVHHG